MATPESTERGRLEAIWIKHARRGPMDPARQATLVTDEGLAGNANQGGTRQVTIIEREVFDRLRETLSPAVQPAMRRANLMVSGVRLRDTRFQILRVGDCAIELRGETRPCERMDEAHPGLRTALEVGWGGGVYGRVIQGGEIRVGDEVWLEPALEAREAAPSLREGPSSASASSPRAARR
jgi:MOSC domain-containing protein YiiM